MSQNRRVSSTARSVPPEPRSVPSPKPDNTTAARATQTPASSRESSGSFEARFGRVILQHGIAAIPAGLLHYQSKLGLDAKHLWFIEYILSCKWDANLPYPSLNRMERCTGVDIRALYRYKKALCEQGYLKVYKRLTEQGGYDSNAYDFSPLFERPETLIAADGPVHNPIGANPTDRGPEPATVDSSFVARYGRVLVRYGVTAVPRSIFTHQGILALTPQQVWFISYIFSFKWDTALPYPSIERMALNTGYSRAYLHEIKASLVSTGYLRLIHRTNEQGGQDSNAYDFSNLLDAIRDHLQAEVLQLQPSSEAMPFTQEAATEPPARRRGRLAAQARISSRLSSAADSNEVVVPGVIEHTGVGTDWQTTPSANEQTPLGVNRHTEVGLTKRIAPSGKQLIPPVHPHQPTHLAQCGQGQVASGRHESETINTEVKNRGDSNHPSPKKKSITKEMDRNNQVYSPYIAAVIADFSTELNDPDHVVSNVTQALRLWQTSGLGEQEFTELLYEAKQNTRLYQGKQGLGTINNKMAYFFTVLRRLIEQPPNE